MEELLKLLTNSRIGPGRGEFNRDTMRQELMRQQILGLLLSRGPLSGFIPEAAGTGLGIRNLLQLFGAA